MATLKEKIKQKHYVKKVSREKLTGNNGYS
jgi:hypothetical protein